MLRKNNTKYRDCKTINAPLAQEYAREYLENIKRDYNYNDLIK